MRLLRRLTRVLVFRDGKLLTPGHDYTWDEKVDLPRIRTGGEVEAGEQVALLTYFFGFFTRAKILTADWTEEGQTLKVLKVRA